MDSSKEEETYCQRLIDKDIWQNNGTVRILKIKPSSTSICLATAANKVTAG